jgi:hypothetical protein
MTNLLNDPQKAAQMGRESRKLAHYYDIQIVQKMHEELYNKLVKQRETVKRYPSFSWRRVKSWMGFSD